MARRSARLQKRSPTPSNESESGSWETARSEPSPPPQRLPSVVESNEPAMQTPRKTATKLPASQLPQPSAAATPLKAESSARLLHAMTVQTPKNTTSSKPAVAEMHPEHYHMSTAKMLDDARWIGFESMGAHTAPPKASTGIVGSDATPTKTPMSTSRKLLSALPSPDFKFRFRSPASGLSPQSSRILGEDKVRESENGGRALFAAGTFSVAADVGSPARKIAVAKGKSSRFSDVHMSEFKKMDSIANHPSAFRADPSRMRPVHTSLKRSPSKAELDKPEPSMKAPSTPLKRKQSKMDTSVATPKIVPASLKRTQSKMDMTSSGSALPGTPSTVRLVPPTRDGRPQSRHGNESAAKRIKRTDTDDAATTRPGSSYGHEDSMLPVPARPAHIHTGLPGLASRLMTPTKSSMARSQSVKTLKSTSMIPSLLRSPSSQNIFSPTNIGKTVKEGIRKTSSSLHRVRSILRSPHRKFSEDPEKIASGTHMSPPTGLNLHKALPSVPSTAPVKKHVNFSTSTLEKAARDHLGKSPSPIKMRAGSEAPSGAVVYPVLHPGVGYPALPDINDSPVASPSRRLTFGGNDTNVPGQFSFQSDKAISFGPASAGTIRMVRKSDASSLVDNKKRKLEAVEESSDKENTRPDTEERSPKKMRTAPLEPPKTPSTASSKLPRRTPKRGSAISKSRLAFLATPKRNQV